VAGTPNARPSHRLAISQAACNGNGCRDFEPPRRVCLGHICLGHSAQVLYGTSASTLSLHSGCIVTTRMLVLQGMAHFAKTARLLTHITTV
jgi:hypothetical protein